jgi:hypothetical protein
LLGCVKVYFHLPYIQTEEGNAQWHAKGKVVPSIPDYTTISIKRINRLDIKIKEDSKVKESKDKDKYCIIAIYSVDIK